MRTTASLLIVSWFAAPGYCHTTVSVDEQDVTATQAIVRVTTDQTGSCTYRVSEGSTFQALVNDVNPALFTSANTDTRPGALLTTVPFRFPPPRTGTEHTFVVGTRSAAKAADGRFYSRALAPNTPHWVGVTCGSDAEVSTTFTTLNLPLGNSAPEAMPFDLTAFGNVAVPNIDWTNESVTYSDPIWGTQLHRATGPEDVGFYSAANAFTYAISSTGHWSGADNALSASSGSLATCDTSASCTASDALALIAVIPTSATSYLQNGAWDSSVSYTDFLVRMWGSGTDPSAQNRTVSVCWSIDDQTCFTSAQNIVLPQNGPGFAGTAPQSWSVQAPWSAAGSTALQNIAVANGAATVNFGAAPGLTAGQQICINGVRNQSVTTAQGGNGLNGCHVITGTGTNSVKFATNAYAGKYTDSELIASPAFPRAQWSSWGTPPVHSMVGIHAGGTITAVSGAVTLSASGSASNFEPDWAPGTKIYIAGSSPACAGNLCTVASMVDSTHLRLVENLSISGAQWSSANFALLVKKTTGTGSVSVSAGYDFVFSANYNPGLDGSGDICNSNYVKVYVDADGNPMSPTQAYLCTMSGSGVSQARTPIYLFIPSTGETRLIARNYQPSVNDYRAWIGWHPTNGASWFVNYPGQSVFQVTYTGDYRALTPGFPQNGSEPDTPEQLTFTDVFGGNGNDMATQIANCRSTGKCQQAINASVFSIPPVPPSTGSAIKGSYLLMTGTAAGTGQNAPGYFTLWNISSVPATLSWASYTFNQFPVGYAGIHAAIQFGTGQFVEAQLNGVPGNGGPFGGPWQATPLLYNSGSGYTANTAVAQTDGFECPAGLDPRWQALGAKPVAQGGVARCLEFRIPGDFCSSHAVPAEAAAFPCPWNPSPSYSLIKPIQEGDEVGDLTYGAVSYGEKMLVVRVTNNSPTSIDLLVFRYGNSAVTPNSGFTCGTYNASEWTHAAGWTMYALPYRGCWGSVYWINALDPAQSWMAENRSITGSHSDFGQGSKGYTYAEAAYTIRANLPMPAQIGAPPTVNVTGSPTFGSSQLPDGYLQSYPSKRQQSVLTPPSEMDWMLDVRSYNPSSGNNAETPEGLFGNAVKLVTGTTHTYLITFASGQTPDPKIAGFVGWAGYHLLGDISGPNSAATFGDTTPWRYCYAYKSGECVSGSAAGNMYVSVPNDDTGSQCTVNSYATNAPCVTNNYPYGFWVSQVNTTVSDTQGGQSRRLTSALVAPGRQYNYTNAKSTPDGQWALVEAPWLEGQRTDMFWARIPPFPAATAPPDNAFREVPVRFEERGPNARVLFGYAENGSTANALYCTSRAEECSTEAKPFAFTASDTRTLTPCASGCTINVPLVPGRIAFIQKQILSSDGSTVVSSEPIEAIAVP